MNDMKKNDMMSTGNRQEPGSAKRPAWREPWVWLVVGLPAVVVVASITTLVIAHGGADALVSTERVRGAEEIDPAMLPAMKARNAAATNAAQAPRTDVPER